MGEHFESRKCDINVSLAWQWKRIKKERQTFVQKRRLGRNCNIIEKWKSLSLRVEFHVHVLVETVRCNFLYIRNKWQNSGPVVVMSAPFFLCLFQQEIMLNLEADRHSDTLGLAFLKITARVNSVVKQTAALTAPAGSFHLSGVRQWEVLSVLLWYSCNVQLSTNTSDTNQSAVKNRKKEKCPEKERAARRLNANKRGVNSSHYF